MAARLTQGGFGTLKLYEPCCHAHSNALQARGIGHSYGTRLKQAAVAAAAAAGGFVLQQNTSNIAERQPIQQVRSGADMGLGTDAAEVPPAARKRKAADSNLQRSTNKRSKAESPCSHGTAVAEEGSGGMEDLMDKGSSNAAGAVGEPGGGESDRMAVDGAAGTDQRRALRLRKGKGTGAQICC